MGQQQRGKERRKEGLRKRKRRFFVLPSVRLSEIPAPVASSGVGGGSVACFWDGASALPPPIAPHPPSALCTVQVRARVGGGWGTWHDSHALMHRRRRTDGYGTEGRESRWKMKAAALPTLSRSCPKCSHLQTGYVTESGKQVKQRRGCCAAADIQTNWLSERK